MLKLVEEGFKNGIRRFTIVIVWFIIDSPAELIVKLKELVFVQSEPKVAEHEVLASILISEGIVTIIDAKLDEKEDAKEKGVDNVKLIFDA